MSGVRGRACVWAFRPELLFSAASCSTMGSCGHPCWWSWASARTRLGHQRESLGDKQHVGGSSFKAGRKR